MSFLLPFAVVLLSATLGYFVARLRFRIENAPAPATGDVAMAELGRRVLAWRDSGYEVLTRYDVEEMIDVAFEETARNA